MPLGPTDGTTIRYPSVANLMVDSADRNASVYKYANNFNIQRPYSLLNGIFSRIATTEVVMEWNTPNITGVPEFGLFTYAPFYYSWQAIAPEKVKLEVPQGFYNVASLLDAIVAQLNTQTPTSLITYTITTSTEGLALVASGAGTGFTTLRDDPVNVAGGCIPFIARLFNGPLGVGDSTDSGFFAVSSAVDLRKYRYVDITSNALTYAQKVKDASTAPLVRDVLCRWYFDYDEQNMLDNYGYPILMGYSQFAIRRIYNPPKQIMWDTNLPVPGVIDFAMYAPDGKFADTNNVEYFGDNVSPGTNFLMTLQVSEN